MLFIIESQRKRYLGYKNDGKAESVQATSIEILRERVLSKGWDWIDYSKPITTLDDF